MPQKSVMATETMNIGRWRRRTKLPNCSNRPPTYPSRLLDTSMLGLRSFPNESITGVTIRQVINTESRHSEVFTPIACMGTIFMDRKVIIAAMVVNPDNKTPHPVSPTASVMEALRLPVSTNRVLKKLYR